MTRARPTARGVLLALLICAAFGCARKQRNEDFVPSEGAGRAALEAYLSAWQRGEPGTSVAGTKPAVEAGDLVRAGGRRLEAFEILGPVPTEAPLCFAVRLKLAGPSEERRERYVVVGLDPLWVMRFAEYEMLMHWDHPMPTAKQPTNK